MKVLSFRNVDSGSMESRRRISHEMILFVREAICSFRWFLSMQLPSFLHRPELEQVTGPGKLYRMLFWCFFAWIQAQIVVLHFCTLSFDERKCSLRSIARTWRGLKFTFLTAEMERRTTLFFESSLYNNRLAFSYSYRRDLWLVVALPLIARASSKKGNSIWIWKTKLFAVPILLLLKQKKLPKSK